MVDIDTYMQQWYLIFVCRLQAADAASIRPKIKHCFCTFNVSIVRNIRHICFCLVISLLTALCGLWCLWCLGRRELMIVLVYCILSLF